MNAYLDDVLRWTSECFILPKPSTATVLAFLSLGTHWPIPKGWERKWGPFL